MNSAPKAATVSADARPASSWRARDHRRAHMSRELYRNSLQTVPDALALHSVTARAEFATGRQALRIELRDEVTVHGKANVDYVDMPTFAALPVSFENGVISVDILSRLNSKAPDYARAFAGLAYRIADDLSSFETVYLRPLNGIGLNPPPPRDRRAAQYFAFPDWRFERLRENYPDDRFEAAADIAPDTWMNLRLEIKGETLGVRVNGKQIMAIGQTKAAPKMGKIGLFVDIGTEAFFSNLEVWQL
jgi:hypothetical protein